MRVTPPSPPYARAVDILPQARRVLLESLTKTLALRTLPLEKLADENHLSLQDKGHGACCIGLEHERRTKLLLHWRASSCYRRTLSKLFPVRLEFVQCSRQCGINGGMVGNTQTFPDAFSSPGVLQATLGTAHISGAAKPLIQAKAAGRQPHQTQHPGAVLQTCTTHATSHHRFVGGAHCCCCQSIGPSSSSRCG